MSIEVREDAMMAKRKDRGVGESKFSHVLLRGMCSKKCFSRLCCHCVDITECTYMS